MALGRKPGIPLTSGGAVNVDNDPTLGGGTPSETDAPSQEAVQIYVAGEVSGGSVDNDPTLGGGTPSETVAPSQEAAQTYIGSEIADAIDNDPTLGGGSPSETVAPSQEAVQTFVSTELDSFNPLITVEDETGTSYSVDAGDNGFVKRFTNNSLCTVTLPDGIAVGTIVHLLAWGTAGIAIQDDGSSTVVPEGDVAQFAEASCLVVATDTWSVQGAVT